MTNPHDHPTYVVKNPRYIGRTVTDENDPAIGTRMGGERECQVGDTILTEPATSRAFAVSPDELADGYHLEQTGTNPIAKLEERIGKLESAAKAKPKTTPAPTAGKKPAAKKTTAKKAAGK